jgi:hypothetical protein
VDAQATSRCADQAGAQVWNFFLTPELVASGARHFRGNMGASMGILISILITFLVIILVLYLINMLPIDGRAKQIVRVIVIIIGVLSLLKYLAVY